ncbi:MAG: MarR family transcriptional regulator [Gammaproteobacteria bacterium]|nr:MAG: MarR family transcriptional regulator [Gammaproteobacteria bacterium]
MTQSNKYAFVEQMGSFFERIGQPKIAGLLFGHLLICNPPKQSAAQLQKAVSASVGSVNTMLRLLQTSGFIERRSEAGSRKQWYWISPGAFSKVLSKRMQLISELKNLAEAGLSEIDQNENTPVGQRLREMKDCYSFFEIEFPALIDKYQSMKEANHE